GRRYSSERRAGPLPSKLAPQPGGRRYTSERRPAVPKVLSPAVRSTEGSPVKDADRFWSPALRGLRAYTPGEQPQGNGWIKLNTNENPYPPSALALQRMAEVVNDSLRLYPDPQALALRETIAGQHGLQVDQ